jgi:branched-chain amino acid transport system ATP-binding protein
VSDALLEVSGLSVHYDKIQALWNVDLQVSRGELFSVIGPNGAGKSSLLHAIVGVVPAADGEIRFRGHVLDGLPVYDVVSRGIVLVPERRHLFPDLSVRENLLLGAYSPRGRGRRKESLSWVHELFPRLRERETQKARTLSGGEAQMLAIGRGLMGTPDLLLLDEPSLGLAPLVINLLFAAVAQISGRGITVLLVEQSVVHALRLARQAMVLESGRVSLRGEGRELLRNPEVRRSYLAEGNGNGA